MTLANGFEKYQEEKYAHEAGYDALMCGISFLWLSEKVMSIEDYRNLVPLFKSFYALNFENDDIMFFENFFYLKGPDIKKNIWKS